MNPNFNYDKPIDHYHDAIALAKVALSKNLGNSVKERVAAGLDKMSEASYIGYIFSEAKGAATDDKSIKVVAEMLLHSIKEIQNDRSLSADKRVKLIYNAENELLKLEEELDRMVKSSTFIDRIFKKSLYKQKIENGKDVHKLFLEADEIRQKARAEQAATPEARSRELHAAALKEMVTPRSEEVLNAARPGSPEIPGTPVNFHQVIDSDAAHIKTIFQRMNKTYKESFGDFNKYIEGHTALQSESVANVIKILASGISIDEDEEIEEVYSDAVEEQVEEEEVFYDAEEFQGPAMPPLEKAWIDANEIQAQADMIKRRSDAIKAAVAHSSELMTGKKFTPQEKELIRNLHSKALGMQITLDESREEIVENLSEMRSEIINEFREERKVNPGAPNTLPAAIPSSITSINSDPELIARLKAQYTVTSKNSDRALQTLRGAKGDFEIFGSQHNPIQPAVQQIKTFIEELAISELNILKKAELMKTAEGRLDGLRLELESIASRINFSSFAAEKKIIAANLKAVNEALEYVNSLTAPVVSLR